MPRVTVNRVELHYEDEGEGRPVVFLHGVWMSSRFFDRQRAYFGARHRYLALDFRGHGQSEQVHEGHMLPQYGRDLRGFLAAVDAHDAVLVGWSMGSMVVWDMIDQFGTEGIAGGVVVGQSPSDYRWPDWPHGFLDLDGLTHAMHAVQDDRDALVRDFVPLMFTKPPSAADTEWMVAEIMRPPASVASAIIFDQTMRDYRPALAKVDVPALVVTGRDDKLVPLAAEELVASAMGNARLVVLEDSGHCPFLEEPERFNQVVDEFVESLA